MKKNEHERMMEEWLDEIYCFYEESCQEPKNIYMIAKYEVAIKSVEMLGYSWSRSENGKHKIFHGN